MISVVRADGRVSGRIVLDREAAVLEVARLLSPLAELSRHVASLLRDLSRLRPLLSRVVPCCLVRVPLLLLGAAVRGFARAPVAVVPLTVVVAGR